MLCVALAYILQCCQFWVLSFEFLCTISIILLYFVLRFSRSTPSASIFFSKVFTLSGKSSTSLSVQLKVGSSFLLTWLFLIVFIFGKVDARFLRFCTILTTCGQFVPQYFACYVDWSLWSKNFPEWYLSAKCGCGLKCVHFMFFIFLQERVKLSMLSLQDSLSTI